VSHLVITATFWQINITFAAQKQQSTQRECTKPVVHVISSVQTAQRARRNTAADTLVIVTPKSLHRQNLVEVAITAQMNKFIILPISAIWSGASYTNVTLSALYTAIKGRT